MSKILYICMTPRTGNLRKTEDSIQSWQARFGVLRLKADSYLNGRKAIKIT